MLIPFVSTCGTSNECFELITNILALIFPLIISSYANLAGNLTDNSFEFYPFVFTVNLFVNLNRDVVPCLSKSLNFLSKSNLRSCQIVKTLTANVSVSRISTIGVDHLAIAVDVVICS